MGYRNKTYIIFDGENDMWAYRYMRGWKVNKNINFDFHDAHDLNTIREWSQPDTVRRRLRERFATGKQAIVLIGENTKHKHRFVRWEMDVALSLGLPVVAVNLNQKWRMDPDRCPPILKGEYVMHVAFRARIIKYALDNFPYFHSHQSQYPGTDWYYPDNVYRDLGIDV